MKSPSDRHGKQNAHLIDHGRSMQDSPPMTEPGVKKPYVTFIATHGRRSFRVIKAFLDHVRLSFAVSGSEIGAGPLARRGRRPVDLETPSALQCVDIGCPCAGAVGVCQTSVYVLQVTRRQSYQ